MDLGRLWHRAPASARRRALRARRWWSRNRPGRRVWWGNLRRSYPFSDHFGLDRGLPIDRAYIAEFLGRFVGDVHGNVMEMSRSTYADAFGDGRIDTLTIVDIDEANDRATLYCDLCEPRTLPPSSFECILFTQTLHLLPDLAAAVDNLWTALAPGGVILMTVPTLSRNDPIGADYWRFTPAGLLRLLTTLLPGDAEIDVSGYGNALAGAASFLGLAVEDVGGEHLRRHDPAFPVIVGARVRKSAS